MIKTKHYLNAHCFGSYTVQMNTAKIWQIIRPSDSGGIAVHVTSCIWKTFKHSRKFGQGKSKIDGHIHIYRMITVTANIWHIIGLTEVNKNKRPMGLNALT